MRSATAWACAAPWRPSPAPSPSSTCPAKKTLVAAEQQRPDVQAQRETWAEWQATLTQADLGRPGLWDQKRAIPRLALPYGPAPPRQPLFDRPPPGHTQ